MSIQLLINQQSPLKDESQEVQKASMCFAYYLCRKFGINPNGREFITQFGFASDNSNCEALSHWVFSLAKELEVDTQEELLSLLASQLERELVA